MEDHRFLTGAHVSLADLMVIPLLYCFSNVPDGEAADGRAPEIAELGAADGDAAEFPGDQAAALLAKTKLCNRCGSLRLYDGPALMPDGAHFFELSSELSLGQQQHFRLVQPISRGLVAFWAS